MLLARPSSTWRVSLARAESSRSTVGPTISWCRNSGTWGSPSGSEPPDGPAERFLGSGFSVLGKDGIRGRELKGVGIRLGIVGVRLERGRDRRLAAAVVEKDRRRKKGLGIWGLVDVEPGVARRWWDRKRGVEEDEALGLLAGLKRKWRSLGFDLRERERKEKEVIALCP